ncbi:MAG TPA: tetratricopeptide repeat protein, partial [Vicinamibacteria bacterium]
AWIGETIADLLPRALAEAGLPVVTRDDRVRAQQALEMPQVPLTRASAIRLAEAAGAGRVIMGTYTRDARGLTLSLRLLDVDRASLSAPFVVSAPPESLGDLIRTAAWDIALSSPPPPPLTREEFFARRLAVPPAALEAYGRGLASREAGAPQKSLERALALAPAFQEARLALGRLQMEAREFGSAVDTLNAVPEGASVYRPARFLLGVALLEVGRYREAAGVYAALVQADPTPAALNNHALAVLRSSGREVRASQVLRKAAEADPESADIAFNLGWALLFEGDAAAAEAVLHEVLQREPLDGHARVLRYWALRQAGREAEAQQEWKGVLALAPSYEKLAAPDLARRFERIVPAERTLPVSRQGRTAAEVLAGIIGRAERLTAEGDTAGALRELTRAAYLDPYAPRVHVLMARAHRARGERDKALNELQMALWSQDDADVRAEMAELLQEMGRPAEARAEAEKVLKLDPKHEVARRVLGQGQGQGSTPARR